MPVEAMWMRLPATTGLGGPLGAVSKAVSYALMPGSSSLCRHRPHLLLVKKLQHT